MVVVVVQEVVMVVEEDVFRVGSQACIVMGILR